MQNKQYKLRENQKSNTFISKNNVNVNMNTATFKKWQKRKWTLLDDAEKRFLVANRNSLAVSALDYRNKIKFLNCSSL